MTSTKLRRSALPAVIALIAITGLWAQNKAPQTGERQLVKLLGLEAQYDKMFTHSTAYDVPDGMLVVAFTGCAGNPATLERQWDPTKQFLIGYSWVPRNAGAKDLTRQAIVAACGKPGAEASGAIRYGRVRVAFNAKGQISKAMVDYNK
jgi:hypothetical protein